jgi:putative DNA primase/helicase
MPLPDTAPPSTLVLLRSAHGLPCAKVLGIDRGRLAVVSSYGRENRWRVEAHRVDTFARYVEVLDAAAGLTDAIIIRGTIDPELPYDPAEGVLRRLTTSPQGGGHWTAAARTWIPVDFDGADIPPAVSVEPMEARIAYLVEALPAPFRGRSVWYQLTSSHGLDGDATKLRARLWFLADGPVSDAALVGMLSPVPAALHVDVSIYRGVQPIYIARPTFVDGIADPVEHRTGTVDGFDGDLVSAAELPEPSDATMRESFAAYAKRAAPATPPHPVELANVRGHILAGSTHGARHMHAIGAACELLAVGAPSDMIADVVGEVIAKQGRAPVAGEVAGILAWAIAKHASGEVRVQRNATAMLLPLDDPPPAPAKPAAAPPAEPPAPPDDGEGGGGGDDGDDDDPPGFGAAVYTANANANAHAFLNHEHPAPAEERTGTFRFTFVCLADGDYCWTGTHYRRMEPGETSELAGIIQRKVGVAVVQTVSAIRRLAHIPRAVTAGPFWIDDKPGDPPAGELVVFRNGVLNLADLVFNTGATLRPHSPRLFTTACLPFDYNPAAKCPAFEAWLAGVFDDEDTRREYRKLLGYCMLPGNPAHRLVMLSGLPRSGKGVTQRLLQALVGSENWTASLLTELGGPFGLEPVYGKRLLTVGEMNDHKETAVTQCAVDRLKAISGGDAVPVNRKGRGILTTPIGAKVVVACNRFPKLLDPSGALVDRLVVFRFEHGHAGREDTSLEARLANELPGIAAQALEGLRVILSGDPLRTPPSAADYVENEVRGAVSPLRDFIQDALAFAPGAPFLDIPRARLYGAYRVWAAEHGRERPLTLDAFLADVSSACGARPCRAAPSAAGGARVYVLRGPGLTFTPQGEAWANANPAGF